MTSTFYPNLPAPERAGGEYTGNDPLTWENSPANGPVALGMQPSGDNNPAGNMGSIQAMTLNAVSAALLEGPLPS